MVAVDDVSRLIDEIINDKSEMTGGDIHLAKEYPELRIAFNRYINARDLFDKYKNKQKHYTLFDAVFGKEYHRDKARVVIAGRIFQKRYEEWQMVLKLIKEY